MKENPSSWLALIFVIGVFLLQPVPVSGQANVRDPEGFFGFVPGSDRNLFHYDQLIAYLQLLDEASGRLKMVEAGRSEMGKTMYIAFISSPQNIEKLDRLKEINRRLALDGDIPDAEREELVREGRVFFMATLSMHSGEVGPSQSAPLIAWQLVTSQDPTVLAWLDDVVYMMVPSHNPDGMDMVVDHYLKYRGTRYEGSSMPGVYHRYIGHNINRDFVTLSMEENRVVSRMFSTEWFPQVMVEKHQMGASGIRYFVPPMHDPIAENIDAELWAWMGIFGTNMLRDMTRDGHAGIAQRTIFDDYWPGSTETCIWKNVIGFLTEAASVKDATPVFIEPVELRGGGKGLAEYRKSSNMPWVWPGGWWRLGDIVNYEISSTMSALNTAHLHKSEILRFRNDLARREIYRGRTQTPYYFVFPREQGDRTELVGIVNLLKEHGVKVFEIESSFVLDGIILKQGDIVVPLAQPYRAFIKEVLEKQEYPVRRFTPGGEVIRPYDITSWSLPLHRGVKVHEVKIRDRDFEDLLSEIEGHYDMISGEPAFPAVFPASENGSYKAAFLAMKKGLKVYRATTEIVHQEKTYGTGSFVVDGKATDILQELIAEAGASPAFGVKVPQDKLESVVMPRIALVETWFHDMDAGWTRFIFDSYHIPYKVVRPAEIEKMNLAREFDVLIFPDRPKSILVEGKQQLGDEYYISNYPPEYAKGMGKKGMNNLLGFIDQGGLVLSWGASVDLFSGPLAIGLSDEDKDEFRLPFRNVGSNLRREGLVCPGSWLRVSLLTGHRLTIGMPSESGVFYRGSAALETSVPVFDTDRRVIASFPEKNLLVSGYIEKEELIGNKPAMVWLKKGKGQLVLYSFNPQFRASTQANFKLLFNALLLK